MRPHSCKLPSPPLRSGELAYESDCSYRGSLPTGLRGGEVPNSFSEQLTPVDGSEGALDGGLPPDGVDPANVRDPAGTVARLSRL